MSSADNERVKRWLIEIYEGLYERVGGNDDQELEKIIDRVSETI